jgi:hypothetical protein
MHMTTLGISGSFVTLACLLTMAAATASADTATPSDSAAVTSPDSVEATPPPDRFAFADNPLPWKSCAIGAGIGAGAYTADLQEVDRLFHAIENSYRSQGWTIPASASAKLGVMVLYSMTARFEKVADVTVQLGRSGKNDTGGDENQVNTNGLIVSRRIVSSPGGNVALVAGAGGGTYGFLFHRTYGGRSPTDTNGVYTTLDWVEIQGASAFWTALGGFKIRPGRHFAIDLQAQYVGMKPATANTPQTGDVSVDLSGYCLGASLAFFL